MSSSDEEEVGPDGNLIDDALEVREMAKSNMDGCIACCSFLSPLTRRRVRRFCTSSIDSIFWVLDNFVRMIGPVRFQSPLFTMKNGILYA